MFRYRLRTLLILLAVGPPVLAGGWFFAVPVVSSVAFWLGVAITIYIIFAFVLGYAMAWTATAVIGFASRLLNRR